MRFLISVSGWDLCSDFNPLYRFNTRPCIQLEILRESLVTIFRFCAWTLTLIVGLRGLRPAQFRGSFPLVWKDRLGPCRSAGTKTGRHTLGKLRLFYDLTGKVSRKRGFWPHQKSISVAYMTSFFLFLWLNMHLPVPFPISGPAKMGFGWAKDPRTRSNSSTRPLGN